MTQRVVYMVTSYILLLFTGRPRYDAMQNVRE